MTQRLTLRTMPLSTTGLVNTQWFLYLDMGSIWCTKDSDILVNEIICEDLMKITQIFVEIWTHLFWWISLKIAKLRYQHYYYFCILRNVALNYHPTKFGDNYKTQCWNTSKTINWRQRTCLQFKDGIRRQTRWTYFFMLSMKGNCNVIKWCSLVQITFLLTKRI